MWIVNRVHTWVQSSSPAFFADEGKRLVSACIWNMTCDSFAGFDQCFTGCFMFVEYACTISGLHPASSLEWKVRVGQFSTSDFLGKDVLSDNQRPTLLSHFAHNESSVSWAENLKAYNNVKCLHTSRHVFPLHQWSSLWQQCINVM